jgi:hypothetical protein
METAMLKLQSQLDEVIKQNEDMKSGKLHEERQVLRQKR